MGRPAAATPRRLVAISPDDGTAIDLRNPAVAAALSWLVPGLGQIYQRRVFKGLVFMAALMGTLLAGVWMGDGRVVYASWRPAEKRWALLGQAGIGCAVLPAMLQARLVNGAAGQPLANLPWFAPPLVRGQTVSEAYAQRLAAVDRDVSSDDFRRQAGGGLRYEPRQPGGQLSLWHQRLGRFFDIGTLYTLLAGLLNLLVIYDAWAGPMRAAADDEAATETPPAAGRQASR